jgi:hypothetical protein
VAFNNEPNREAKLIETAILLFNEKPELSLKFCFQNQILEQTPAAVGSFLFSTKGLSKFSIGFFISEEDEFN